MPLLAPHGCAWPGVQEARWRREREGYLWLRACGLTAAGRQGGRAFVNTSG